MKYPVGHPRCLIGPNLDGYNIHNLEGIVRCTILPPQTLYLPLLPSKVNGKLTFALCRLCAEIKQTEKCNHGIHQRAFTGNWITLELQKAVSIGYVVLAIHEAWHYQNTTQYNQITGDGGMFSRYMDTFLKQKTESSGFPNGVKTDEEKLEYIERTKQVEGIELDMNNIERNPGSRAVAKLCLNNLWGKLGQRANLARTKFLRHPREMLELLASDTVDVNDCHIVNEECLCVTYTNTKGFEKQSPNTNPIIASYVTTHARLELYNYLEKLQDRVLYYDTDSIIYKSAPGQYEPPISQHMGGMTDELSGDIITEFVSNGAKTYAYRTNSGDQIIKCKGFTLNKIASDKLTFDAMKNMAISDNDASITVSQNNIRTDPKRRRVCTQVESKVYTRTFDKRIRRPDHTSVPYGYREDLIDINTVAGHVDICF